MKTLKIQDLNELKITSVKLDGAIVHFKYMNNSYTIINGGMDSTLCIKLFHGDTKGKLDLIEFSYGFAPDLIQYKHNKKVLKYIDKEHFVWRLKSCGIFE